MQVFISNREIAEIAEGLVRRVYVKPPPDCVDIDRIAEKLKLNVIYEQIAEPDKDKIGFTSDGKTPLLVNRDGKIYSIVFKKNTIVLDRFLLQPNEENRRRFTLAHEIGHILLMKADPSHNAACFNRVYDNERVYNLAELRERMNLGEWQANTMGAALLMPRYLMNDIVKRLFGRTTIPVFGDSTFLPDMKPILSRMSKLLVVSYTAMIIQLKKYNLLEEHAMSEYIAMTFLNGGDCDE